MSKHPHDEINLLVAQSALSQLQMGCDLENRCIYLIGGIDAATAYRFLANFKLLDRIPGPIHIILCSEGGEIPAGFAIYDTLRTANNPTMIEGIGIIASAAVPILLAGTVRWLNPEAKVMIHEMSWDVDGSIGSELIASMAKETETVNKRYREIIAARTGKSIKDIEKWCKEETVFSAEEAIKLGFADKNIEVRPIPKTFEDGMSELKAAALQAGMKVRDDAEYEIELEPPKKKRRSKKGAK